MMVLLFAHLVMEMVLLLVWVHRGCGFGCNSSFTFYGANNQTHACVYDALCVLECGYGFSIVGGMAVFWIWVHRGYGQLGF